MGASCRPMTPQQKLAEHYETLTPELQRAAELSLA